MSKHGELTALVGKSLKFEGCDVFFDHNLAGKYVGKIVSTTENPYNRIHELSQLDIAIVERDTNRVVVLVEIEESADRPKTIIGDIFGVLCGEHICFQRREFQVGDFTTFIVAGISKTDHRERNQYILDQVSKVKPSLETQNARIGKVVIETYREGMEMSDLLPSMLDRALMVSPKCQ